MKVCANCGGKEGLHEYRTLRCPRNGQESPVGHPQLWQNTFWDDGKTEDDIETLKANIDALHLTIKNLMKRVEDLEDDFYQHENNVRIHNG